MIRNVARNTTVQFVGEGLSKLASLALYVVVARVAGPTQFGNLIFAMSLALLTTAVASFGVEGVIVRRVSTDRTEAERMLTASVTIRVAFGVAGILGALAVAFIGNYSSQVRIAVGVFAVAAVLDLVAKSYYAMFQAFDDMRPLAICLLLQRSWTAALGIALVVAGAGVAPLSAVFLSGSVLALLVVARWLRRHGVTLSPQPSHSAARDLARESFALGVAQAFNTVLFRGDATMLSLMQGNLAVGLYGVAYRALESTLFITYDFVAALAPTLARLRRDTTPSIARAYEFGCRALALLLVPIGDIFVAFPHAIVHLLYGSKYDAAAGVLRILGGAIVTYGFSYVTMSMLVGQHRDRVLPGVHLVAAVENVALNLVLIPTLSYTGAAISTTVAETTRTVMLMWFGIRTTGPLRWGRIMLAPGVGTVVIAAIALVLGTSLPVLVLAGIAYVAVVLVVEHLVFPADAELVRSALTRRTVTENQLG